MMWMLGGRLLKAKPKPQRRDAEKESERRREAQILATLYHQLLSIKDNFLPLQGGG
jgi:hypothetical protein